MALYFVPPKEEAAYSYNRYYLQAHTDNHFVMKLRHYKMFDWRGDCFPGCYNCSKSTCEYEQWLMRRVLAPHGCRFFYIQRVYWIPVSHYNICDPAEAVRHYESFIGRRANKSLVCKMCEACSVATSLS